MALCLPSILGDNSDPTTWRLVRHDLVDAKRKLVSVLTNIIFTAGDPPRGGRYVLIINFYVESGQKLIQFINFGQVEVQRGEAELNFNLTKIELEWSCTR